MVCGFMEQFTIARCSNTELLHYALSKQLYLYTGVPSPTMLYQCKCLGCSLCLWPTLTAGAIVSLNETDIVVQEGDGNTTIDICVVLQDGMGGLERDIVVTIMLICYC